MLQSSRGALRGGLVAAALLALGACNSGSPAPAESAPAASAEQAAPAGEHLGFRVDTEVVGEGDDAVLVTTVLPADGYKLNMEYPRWAVTVDETAPVAAGESVARDAAQEFTEDRAVFRIPVTSCPSEGEVGGQLRLSVCNDEACLTPTETVAWNLAERR